jgi:hypothetical protein
MSVRQVRRKLDELAAAALIETGQVTHNEQPVTVVRASTRLHADPPVPFVSVPGELVFGGLWQAIPTTTARKVLLVVAQHQAVRNPIGWGKRIKEDETNDGNLRRGVRGGMSLEDRRRASPLTLKAICEASGHKRREAGKAVRTLVDSGLLFRERLGLRYHYWADFSRLPVSRSGTTRNAVRYVFVRG